MKKRVQASDTAFVQELAEEDDPPPPADWDALIPVLVELNTAPRGRYPELFAKARKFAMQSDGAISLIERKKRDLGVTDPDL